MSEANEDWARLWIDDVPRGQNAAELVRERQAKGQEESAVKYVLTLMGQGQKEMLREAKARTGNLALDFQLFREVYPEFPVPLAYPRLHFHYDGVATDLFNDIRATPMFTAWLEWRERLGPRNYVALVFRWPRVKRCKQFCVFHDVPRQDDGEVQIGQVDKKDPRLGFRLALPDRKYGIFSIEPLPAFMAALGVLAVGDFDDD